MIGCVLNPGGCISDAVASIVSIIPYGTHGLAFAAGMIVGAILGKWGVGAVLGLVLAVNLGSQSEPHEHVDGDEDPPVKRRKSNLQKMQSAPKRPSLLDSLRRLGKR